ncbi:hypothetical protein V2A60_003523 [Cordyceps javanica]|uniref:Jumonji domain-containing 5 n=1 Tax=Cordyceps javanica TaxID=43265 RepID=A0A545UUM7_9HYPO|nr:jumonji domain-containing 5 [Cordyceps javanica]TQW05064.1 jumonji domain containing 5 [Cordyceps javanica]
MSYHPFILPAFKRLLDRYHEATKELVEATDEETTDSDGQPISGGIEDFERQAIQNLLNRQAYYLLDTFEDAIAGTYEVGSFDDLVARRLKDIEFASHARLYAYRFDEAPSYWRQIYSDAQVLTTFHILLKEVNKRTPHEQRQAFLKALDEVVARLDQSIITAGGGRILDRAWIEGTIKQIDQVLRPISIFNFEEEFSELEPNGRPGLSRPCERHQGWNIDEFERHMREGHALAMATGTVGPEPIVFTDLTKDTWPALLDKKWVRPSYLLQETLGGRRLVPVEIGRSYAEAGWGQELLPFKEFLVRFIDRTIVGGDTTSSGADSPGTDANKSVPQPGYLAQHDLFRQIPALREDIMIPDFCWASVPSFHPFDPAKVKPTLQEPELNAWFGPAGTTTPLHTDLYNNLLCQVVGTKYVRLYPPQADEYMRPMPKNVNGVDMSNTSAIDLGLIEGWDECDDDFDEAADFIREVQESLEDVEYFECILEPGDTLLIPVGWWHYVRSLSVSFSVSFWWN